MPYYILVLVLPFLSSCAGYRLYGQRSFAEEMSREDNFWVVGRDFPITAGDKGPSHRSFQEINARTPASFQERAEAREQSRLTSELIKRESSLSHQELQQYTKIKGELGNLSEKIYYLQLSPAERREYISMRIPRERRPWFKHHNSSFHKDITPNMSKEEVVHLWGRPSLIEVAGEPAQQNERWIFIRLDGRRTLYFEGGRVRGWTILD